MPWRAVVAEHARLAQHALAPQAAMQGGPARSVRTADDKVGGAVYVPLGWGDLDNATWRNGAGVEQLRPHLRAT
eukprot:5931122-Prymnesium_polylepis.1